MPPMDSKRLSIAFLIVATAFLLYTLYQSTTTTIFVSHFPSVITQLPNFIQSSNPSLQLALFLFQEIAGSVGSYLRLIGAVFALNCAVLFFKKDDKCLGRLRLTVLFESLYFLLLFPAGINHLVGSTISSSTFLNFYTGISCLLQAAIIFPPLFMLSQKLRKPHDQPAILKWASLAAPLYVFGFWIRHGLFWVYALSPLAQGRFIEIVGSVNSLLTLLVATVVTIAVSVSFRKKKRTNTLLVGSAIVLVGVYFVIYDLVAVWVSAYRDFLPLTDFWMVAMVILGVAILSSRLNSTEESNVPNSVT